MCSPEFGLPDIRGFFPHNKPFNIVMESKVSVKYVFQESGAVPDNDVAPPLPAQPAEPGHSLVCCSCLKTRSSLLVGECACLLCRNCCILQARSLYCVNCDLVVKYTKLETLLKFPALGRMGELFLTKEAFGNLRVAELTETIRKQEKLQEYVSKILDKQDAAWRRKTSLEKEELLKTRRKMECLSRKISAKLESIAALEKSIEKMHLTDSAKQQEWPRKENYFATRGQNGLQGLATGGRETRQALAPSSQQQQQAYSRQTDHVHVQVPSRQSGKCLAPSRLTGQVQVRSRQTGKILAPSKLVGQVQVPSRQTGLVLASRRPTRQVQIPIEDPVMSNKTGHVLLPKSSTEQVSAPSCQVGQVLPPGKQAGQVLSSSSKMDYPWLPRLKNKALLVPKELAGQLEKVKKLSSQAQQVKLLPSQAHKDELLPSQAHKDKLLPSQVQKDKLLPSQAQQGNVPSTEPKQASNLAVPSSHSRDDLLSKLGQLQASSASTKPVITENEVIQMSAGQYQETLPNNKPTPGSSLVTQADQVAAPHAKPVKKLDAQPSSHRATVSTLSSTQGHAVSGTKSHLACNKQKTVGQTNPAVSQLETVGHPFPAVIQQKGAGPTRQAVTQKKMAVHTKQAVTQKEKASHTVQAVSPKENAGQTKPAVSQLREECGLSPPSRQLPPAASSTLQYTQRQVLPSNLGPPTLPISAIGIKLSTLQLTPAPAVKADEFLESMRVGEASNQQMPRKAIRGILKKARPVWMDGSICGAGEANKTLHRRDEEGSRRVGRTTGETLQEGKASGGKKDANTLVTIPHMVEDQEGAANANNKRKRKWKLASGVKGDLPEVRKMSDGGRRNVIPAPGCDVDRKWN